MKRNVFFIKVGVNEDIAQRTTEVRAKSKKKAFEGSLVWRGYIVETGGVPVEGIVVCFDKERSAIKAANFGREYAKSICPRACTVNQLFLGSELRWRFYTEIEISYTAIHLAGKWRMSAEAVEANVTAAFVRLEVGRMAIFGSIESDSSSKRIIWYEEVCEICEMMDFPRPIFF